MQVTIEERGFTLSRSNGKFWFCVQTDSLFNSIYLQNLKVMQLPESEL